MRAASSLCVTEVDRCDFFIGELFKKKFASDAPEHGRHVIGFCRAASGSFVPIGYANFWPFGDIILVGGVCTDGAAIRDLPAATQDAIREMGGCYKQILRFGFHRFRSDCEAFFGYCGDERALAVNLSTGFTTTEHDKLLVNFHKPLHEVMQRALVTKAHAIGPF